VIVYRLPYFITVGDCAGLLVFMYIYICIYIYIYIYLYKPGVTILVIGVQVLFSHLVPLLILCLQDVFSMGFYP